MAKQKEEKPGEGYPEYDEKSFKQMQELASDLQSDYKDRDGMIDDMEQYWSMNWRNPIPKDNNQTAVTYDTDMTNRLMGAFRLLTATAPEFSVPTDQNSPEGLNVATPLEHAAKMMWAASGKARGMPLEKELVLAALMTGACDILLTNLLDDEPPDEPPVDEEGRENSVSYWRRKAIETRTPVFFEPANPRFGYPLRAKYGLQAYVRRYDTTVAKFREEWADVDTIGFLLNKKGSDKLTIQDGINENVRYAWIDSDKRPFYVAENKVGIIPVISQVTEGSLLFGDPSLHARPFLYTAHKSNLPMRKSMSLTAIYSIIKSIAMSATWKHKNPSNNPNKGLQVKMVGPLSVFEMEGDEDIVPMLSKGAIDPAILTALEIASQQIAESTIYSQALGEPLGANAPFSMVALLHQAGRLPLTSPKILTGWAIASAMELAFLWMKASGKTLNLSSMQQSVTIKPDEIPFNLQFEAKLEIDLPQDIREVASVVGAFAGKVSNRWIRENLMKGVGQSEAMQEEVWSEQAGQFFFERMLTMFAMMEEQGGGQTPGFGPGGAGGQADQLGQRAAGAGDRDRPAQNDDFLSRNDQPTPNAQGFAQYGRQGPVV